MPKIKIKIRDAHHPLPERRFWGKVVKHKNGCWEWIGSTTGRDNYGRFHFQGKNRPAHWVAWFLTYGVWPTDQLRHDCDNPPCVRPSHLREGSQLDNIRDCISRGRFKPTGARGANHGHVKLTIANVRKIRTAGIPDSILAKRFKVGTSTVVMARLGYSWKWVTDPPPVRRNA